MAQMGSVRFGTAVAVLCAGCLGSPMRPTSGDDAGAHDARASDAPVTDARPVIDGPVADAALPPKGVPFPPAGMGISITGGWTGDLNGDGIDDVVLLSNTDMEPTTGVYVLFGQQGKGVPDYHQFLHTGVKAPYAVTATQLDGAGFSDLLVFAVDFKADGPGDNLSYLLAFTADGSSYRDPPLSNTISQGQAWQVLFSEDEPAMIQTLQRAPAVPRAVAVVHGRGGFTLSYASWSDANFLNATPEMLVEGRTLGALVLPNGTNASVDDLLTWTDTTGDLQWLVNDGSGGLSPTTVNAEVRGPNYAALYDMDGTPPLDVIGVIDSEIQAVPVDTSAGTTSAEYNGQSYITGVGSARGMLVFDSNVATSDPRPELVIATESCTTTSDNPCLYMIRNAYIDGASGNLLSPSSIRYWELPAGMQPRALFRGDFDGDGAKEVLVFGLDGSMACARADDEQFSSCS